MSDLTRLSELSKSIAAQMQEALPDLKECTSFAGRLDVEELKRRSIQAPAVLVSRLRLVESKAYSGPTVTFDVSMAAFIVTKDRPGLTRDDAAANIASVLLSMIPECRWGLSWAGEADKVSEEPLISSGTRRDGVAISAVLWRQPITLNRQEDPVETPIQLYLGTDPFAPSEGSDDYAPVGDVA
jgi:hypothetical protein